MHSAANLRRRLIAGMGAATAAAGVAPAFAADNAAIEEIVVTGTYRVEKLSSEKYTLPLVDTPKTVSVISDQLLIEQGRRTLRDSMRNVTGISFQAGEGNPPGGGDALSIRGFSGRDDIFVDGIRDPGNYFRDPFNADRIEVTKGPASAVNGRGNIGGTVNVVSRKPSLDPHASLEVNVGTDNLYRLIGDANFALDRDAGVAFRISVMAHDSEEPGRNVVKNDRWGVAPSLTFGLGGPTEVNISYLRQRQDDIPDFGLPNARNFTLAGSGFEGRVAPVARENFYGYANDYRDVEVDLYTLSLRQQLGENATATSKFRYGRAHNDSIMSAPRFVGAVTTLNAATQAVGNRKPRDQIDEIIISQNDLAAEFTGFGLKHSIVAGFELSFEDSENRRRLDANGPNMNLFNPALQLAAAIPYNGTRARLESDTASLYFFDTIELSPHWIITGGVRQDFVETRVESFDDNNIAPAFVIDLSEQDSELSWNAALVFKPSENSSLYFAYGTAFESSGRAEVVQLAGGNNNAPVTAASFRADPERSRAFEFGAKYDVYEGRLALAAALFQIDKTNARTPGVNPGDPAVVLEGEQRIRGFEFSAVGAPTPRWNVFSGYTYLDGEVRKSNIPFENGQRLDNTPRHSFSVWTSYALTDALLVGGGVQHVGERRSDVRASATGNVTVVMPAYTVLDAFLEYQLTNNVLIRLNGYNLADEVYYQSFSSGQSIPSAGRAGVLSVGVSF